MVLDFKFGHRATTSLSTHIAAAEENWRMASYILKIGLDLYPRIIFTFFQMAWHLMWLLSHYKPQIIAKESPSNELPFLLLLQSYAVNYSYLTVDPQIYS